MHQGSRTVGAFDAKTHLSSLLERVARGEEITITRHGRPIARLVPAVAVDRARVDEAIAKLKAVRKGSSLGGLSWKELRDEGRR
jgi:prevent-host-death family protein